MNKKIASEIAVGIILLLAIIIGGIFWVQEIKQMQIETATPVVQTSVIQPAKQPQAQPVNETMNWQTYRNENLDLAFNYPNNWKLSKEKTFFESKTFQIGFATDDGDEVNIYGNNSIKVGDIYGGFGECAKYYKSLGEFCGENKCIEINKETEMAYESPMIGERVYLAYVYTMLSKNYPFICAEATINEMYNIVDQRYKNGQQLFGDSKGGQDIQAYIANNAINEKMNSYVANLTKFAESIAPAVEK